MASFQFYNLYIGTATILSIGYSFFDISPFLSLKNEPFSTRRLLL